MEIKYEIYQIKDLEKCNYAFRSFDITKFNFADYEKVYSGSLDIDPNNTSANDMLESLFTTFNIRRPSDFEGHSMSVSDIVCLIYPAAHNEEDKEYYYVDSVGFKHLESDYIK